MVKKIVFALIVALMVSGTAFSQVRLWWWGRAQITPYERSWDMDYADGHQDGFMNSYIWWSRFGIYGNHAGTVGFDAETATMLTGTATQTDGSHLGGYWASWGDFWSYSLWYKPLTWLSLRVGKYNYLNEGSAWVMDFFDRTRYSVVGLGEDEFFAGYDNIVQLNPGVSASGGSVSAGTLLEGFFGPLTVILNLKSLDPQMSPLDYLQTIQIGARYDVPGLGFFRLQMIGFDPDGKIAGSYLKVNNATSQIQAAANITGFPGMEFRIGFHYFLSSSRTNWADGLNATYNFEPVKNSLGIPLGVELTMLNPLSIRLVGHFQFGYKEGDGGQTQTSSGLTEGDPWKRSIWTAKASAQVKYVLSSNLSAMLNVSAYNFGRDIFTRDIIDSVDGSEWIEYYIGLRDYAIDFGLGIQLTGIRGANIQTGIIIQYHTEDRTQLGFAIPFTFDFGF